MAADGRVGRQLEHKVAVIYGGGGAIGGAVARAFAREGARLFLAGRTQAKLDTVAHAIRAQGGSAETAVVDALDEQAVTAYVDVVAKEAGSIDISCNVIRYGDIQEPLMEIAVEEFLHFGGGGPQTLPGLGGFKIALDAMEGLRRQWAVELGPHGIRVVTLKTGGIPESIPDGVAEKGAITAGIEQQSLLGRAATLADVGNVAAFLASDHARTITATEVNVSCGAIME